MAIEEARGEKITIRFDGHKCIHARHCVLGAPGVFKANVQGPWMDPDAASVEAIVAVAHACPSGAISYERRDGGPQETPPLVNLVNVREDGPLAFRGDLRFDGKPAGTRATLCRCGASKNKPWCDGSHAEAGFKASGEPETKPSEPLEARDGPVEITAAANGPLLVAGNLEICSGTGRTILRAAKAAFCRCGASANKPYCDGTHKKIGFVAP